MMVIDHPLEFNMLLGHDFVYAMNVVVSSLFQVMYFHHNGNIVTIDQLASNNHPPNSNLIHNTPWYVPSVEIDFTRPWVNYVALYLQCSIAYEKDPLNYYFPSRDLVLTVDHVISYMGTWDPLILPFDPSSSHGLLEIDFPSQE